MKKIFISYAHIDKETAESVSRHLQDLGYDVWIDTRRLRGGSVWSKEIELGIINCDVFLLMISPHSMKSKYVRKEIRMAIDKSKYLVTLKIEHAEIPKSLKSPLADIQWVDYEQSDWESRLLVALENNITDQSEQTRRFEGAMPKISELQRPTELRVMISLPDSEGLRKYLPENSEVFDEITQKDVKGNEIPLRFPVDAETNFLLDLNLFLSLKAPDFYVENPSLKILVPPGNDSGVFTFSMTPQKANPRSLIVLNLFCDESNSILVGSLTVTTQIKSWQERIVNDTIKVVWQIAASPLKLLINEEGTGILMHSHQPLSDMFVRDNVVETPLQTPDSPQEILSQTTSILDEFVKALEAVVDTDFWKASKFYNIKEQFVVVERQLKLLKKQIMTKNLLSDHESIFKIGMRIRAILHRLWNVKSRLYDAVILDGPGNGPRTASFLSEFFALKEELKYLNEVLSVLSNHEQSDVDKHE